MVRSMQNAPHDREVRALPEAVITSHHITVRLSLASHRAQSPHTRAVIIKCADCDYSWLVVLLCCALE